ncbi:unnamed protein product [Cunninghamella blakesleeana]
MDTKDYKYSKHGVIVLGKGISPKLRIDRQPCYWYMNASCDDNKSFEVEKYKEYIDSVIDSLTGDNMEKILDNTTLIIGKNHYFVFLRTFFTTLQNVYRLCSYLSGSESILNGEVQLASVTTQLESIGTKHDERYRHNADGVSRINGLMDVELLLLETSGSFSKDDNTKFSFDFHKAMFGLLPIIKTIADKYEYASLASIQKLKVYFLHVSGNVCRYWSLNHKDYS